MIKKWLKYGVVMALFAMGFSHKGNASTDYIIAGLNEASFYTQIGISVTKEISNETKKIASYKINPGGWIGDKAAMAQEKIELAQEKVEYAQEKKDKVEKRIQWAKDAKDSLMAKWNDLNAKVAQYREKAEKAIAEGKKIRDQYQTYKAEVTNAVDKVKDAKKQLSEGIDAAKGTAGAVGDLAKNKLSEAKSKVGISDSKAEARQNEEQNFSVPNESLEEYEEDDKNWKQNEDSSTLLQAKDKEAGWLKQQNLTKIDKTDKKELDAIGAQEKITPALFDKSDSIRPAEDFAQAASTVDRMDKKELDAVVAQEKIAPISNKADSIRSAGDFAQAVSAEDLQVEMPNTLEGLSMPEPTGVSVEEVMSIAQKEKSEDQPEQQTEMQTELNIEDQLIKASNRPIKQLNKKAEKEILLDKTDKNLSREKFQKEDSFKKINTKSKSSSTKGLQKKQKTLLKNEIQEKDNVTARSIRYEKQ